MASPVSISEQAVLRFKHEFDAAQHAKVVSVPGRVNLIGEHVDYHGLPVLPIAIQRHVSVAFAARSDDCIVAVSSRANGEARFRLKDAASLDKPGSWSNYLRAAAVAMQGRSPVRVGVSAAIASDLPVAAGLSSSTALLAAMAVAILRANCIEPKIADLLDILPNGEQVVGTRGGAMDHAAVLAGHAGCALHIAFNPMRLTPIRIPRGWTFLVAHSMSTAEKSHQLRSAYNSKREAGVRALRTLELPDYKVINAADVEALAGRLSDIDERNAFRHVVGERDRVSAAAEALERDAPAAFGELLTASHRSLRDLLGVSTPALDLLVSIATEAGALGARLTGAGFGGCAVILCRAPDVERIEANLIQRFYSKFPQFRPTEHLFPAQACSGALASKAGE